MKLSHLLLVFAVSACLLTLTCAAEGSSSWLSGLTSKSGMWGNIQSTIMGVVSSIFKSNIFKSFSLTKLFGLFDSTIEILGNHKEQIEGLYNQGVIENKEIQQSSQNIKSYLSTNSKASKDSDYSQKVTLGNNILNKLEVQKKNIEEKFEETQGAMDTFNSEQNVLMISIVPALVKLKTLNIPGAIALISQAAQSVVNMYKAYKTLRKASSTTEEILKASQSAAGEMKNVLNEMKEIEKKVKQTTQAPTRVLTELKHAEHQLTTDASFGSSFSYGFAFMTTFLTLCVL